MNDFKYQKKPDTPDEVMNSFKDFKKVMEKHNVIKSGYNSVWKWTLAASAGLSVIAGVWLTTDSSSSNLPTENNIAKYETSKTIETPTIIQASSIIVKEEKFESKPVIKLKNQPKELSITPKEISKEVTLKVESKKDKVLENESKESDKENLDVKTSQINQEKKSNAWFTVNELPEEKRIHLPTLYVAKLAWPSDLSKTELIKFPKVNAIYKSVGREIPIVDGKVYITSKDATKPSKSYSIKDNNFPPGLIRDIHKSGENSIMLFKNVKLFIPGKGYVNIGDQVIDIHADDNYQDKLDDKLPVE